MDRPVSRLPGVGWPGLCALVLVLASPAAPAATRTWTGGGDRTNWSDAANWSLSQVPQADDDITISNAYANVRVLLTNATPALRTLTITNATLAFSNWFAAVTASNVTIRSAGVMTHALCDTNAAPSNTNRVYILCSNLLVDAGGSINVQTSGYRGGVASALRGQGPGGGGPSGNGCGGGYGGFGGKYYSSSASEMGQTYGSATVPADPGSGGGANGGYAGGGAIWIDAAESVVVNGTINANGGSNPTFSYTGCGSGGGIRISCRTFAGTNGYVTADGGAAVSVWGYMAGGGGGGRIAVTYDPAAQSNLNAAAGRPSVQFWANPGQIAVPSGTPGTLSFTDDQLLQPVIRGGQFVSFTSWNTPSLMVSNGWAIFPTGLMLTVTGDLTVWGSLAPALLTNPASVNVGGRLIVTNSATLTITSLPTNGAADYGTLVSITDSLLVASGSSLYPCSDPTNGGSILFCMSHLSVAAGATVDASGRGYAGGVASHGLGPGGGQFNVSAGGYGGKGNGAATVNGTNFGWSYGSSNAPASPGSGGGGASGGAGGGLVRMRITNEAAVAGSILANGTGGTLGGSGGGIHLSASRFAVALGTIRAEGGTGGSKGGGGGRIALTDWTSDWFGGTVSAAAGGTGASTGEVGTIVRRGTPVGRTLTVSGDPARHGSSSPYEYGSSIIPDGAVVTNSVTLTGDESNGLRYICYAWSLTNEAGPVSGGGPTQAVFTVDTNLFLTWSWTNQYYLSTTAVTNGSLSPDRTGWYTNGLTTQLTAVPDGGCVFLQWAGSGVPPGHQTDNPLTLVMDRARDVQAVFIPSGSATTRTWTGSNSWFTVTNWSPAGIPSPDDSVILKSGTCLLTDPARVVNVLVSNGATLAISTTNTMLTATDIVITNGGVITHALNTDTSAPWVMDNAVVIACTNLAVRSGGKIDGSGRGYGGGVGVSGTYGLGPGGGGMYNGGGYGGYAGIVLQPPHGGATNGSLTAPDGPGSGGGVGDGNGSGAAGGGYIRIDAAGTMAIDGVVTVNGASAGGSNNRGAGSGGGILLSCQALAGSGLISASGGSNTTFNFTGGGGGGRIAILCNNVSGWTGTVQAAGGFSYGATSYGGWNGQPGTLYVTDSRILRPVLNNQAFRLNGAVPWAPSSLSLSNSYIAVEDVGFTLHVTNAFTCVGSTLTLNYEGPVIGQADLRAGGDVSLSQGSVLRLGRDGDANKARLEVGGHLVITNNSQLWLYAGPTNAPAETMGGTINVVKDIRLGGTSTLNMVSHPTNGGSVFVWADNVMVLTGSTVNAYASGYRGGWHGNGWGIGGGLCPYHPGGAGYGGHGGREPGQTGLGGITYGSSNAPASPGSGGGGSFERPENGGRGGGFIWMTAANVFLVDGTMNANGETMGTTRLGGGSGGGMYVRCRKLRGMGTLTANGGAVVSYAGKGGGGRIAVWRVKHEFTGTAAAVKGIGAPGDTDAEDGTVFWGQLYEPGTLFVVH